MWSGWTLTNEPPCGTERSDNGLGLTRTLAMQADQDAKEFLLGNVAACAKAGQKAPDTYNFRIAVPAGLPTAMKTRKLMRTLKAPEPRTAVPRALYLASNVLALFATLQSMPDDQREMFQFDYTVKFDLDGFGTIKRIEAHLLADFLA